jgi:hypothetical protein
MVEKNFIIGNEQGSAIIYAILILAVLTILGISSTNTSEIELKIVSNERIYQRDFYIADSAWKYGAYWLDVKPKAPSKVNSPAVANPSDEEKVIAAIVRNFGDGGQDVLNDGFPDGTNDGNIDAIPYWYNVQYGKNVIVPGSGKNYRKFIYIVKSNANKKQEIEVRAAKVYKIGY